LVETQQFYRPLLCEISWGLLPLRVTPAASCSSLWTSFDATLPYSSPPGHEPPFALSVFAGRVTSATVTPLSDLSSPHPSRPRAPCRPPTPKIHLAMRHSALPSKPCPVPNFKPIQFPRAHVHAYHVALDSSVRLRSVCTSPRIVLGGTRLLTPAQQGQ
jgi:hypothetical protein